MSYQEMNDRYRGPDRGRYEACAREQAHATYAASDDPPSAALADAVIAGQMAAIDALIAAVCVGPNSAALDSDPDLMAAMQASWAATGAAMYPQPA